MIMYVPENKYHVSPERLSWLLEKAPDAKEFAQAYADLKLKDLMEYFGINVDDVYILMHHHHVPYKQPKSAVDKAHHTRRHSRRSLRDFGEPAASPAAVGAEIDYDRLADAIVTRLARYILKGYVEEKR